MKKNVKKVAVALVAVATLTAIPLPKEEKEGTNIIKAEEKSNYEILAENIEKDKEMYKLNYGTELYNVPLDQEIQEYLISEAHLRGLDPKLVLAVCSVESDYDMNCITDNDYGLMQINKVNHSRLEEKLELMDIFDVYDNISAGCELLYEIKQKYPDEHRMLMVYNMGESGAKRCWNEGKYSSKYSRKVLRRMAEIERI